MGNDGPDNKIGQEYKYYTPETRTKEQEDKIRIMDALQQKYPNSLKEMTDPKGRKVLVAGEIMSTTSDVYLKDVKIFTQEGAFNISRTPAKALDTNRIVDAITGSKVDNPTSRGPRRHAFKTEEIIKPEAAEYLGDRLFRVRELDLGNSGTREGIRDHLSMLDTKKPPSVDEIIGDL